MQYKDAFFSANPDFKWYKLPAPPLRTLTTRPLTIQRETSPLQSPNDTLHTDAQFTPGKLADESQLGMLSSLLKSDSFSNKSMEVDHKGNFNNNNNMNNNFNDSDREIDSAYNNTSPEDKVLLPPKPLKKRIFEQTDNNNPDSNLMKGNKTDFASNKEVINGNNNADNMTKQELYEKVVDSMFQDEEEPHESYTNGIRKNKSKETRKSGRSCKGKRYEEFMIHGKLLKNKREKKMNEFNFKIESELNCKLDSNNDDYTKNENQTPKLDLENTIKRLAERTNINLDNNNKKIKLETNDTIKPANDTNSDNFQNSDFNLELRIEELPFLSYDSFVQRKRDSKKRKQFKCKTTTNSVKQKGEHANNKAPVGSKKRKNKNNITHLEKNSKPTTEQDASSYSTDLSGLATLAEIAANKEKINE